MTDAELRAEWFYRYEERLGILTDGRRQPDAQERDIARREAGHWLADYRRSANLFDEPTEKFL